MKPQQCGKKERKIAPPPPPKGKTIVTSSPARAKNTPDTSLGRSVQRPNERHAAGRSPGHQSIRDRSVDLIALGAVPHRRVAVPPVLGAAGAHDPLVHRGLHAVVLLDVQLGERVVVEHRCLADITEGRGVHDVPVRGKYFQDKTDGPSRKLRLKTAVVNVFTKTRITVPID